MNPVNPQPQAAREGQRAGREMWIVALAHARAGRAVIPLHSVMANGACTCQKGIECDGRGKHPHFDKDLFPDGVTSATTVESTVRRWWGKWPQANIGIATGHRSGFWILDVDPRHGGDETLAELERAYGELPHTVESLTVGGGRHIAFQLPRDFTVRNIQTPKDGDPPLGAGLDLRGEGGYIVGAGSRGDGGRGWNWDTTRHPDDTPIAEAPPWLLHMVQRAMNAGRAGPAAPIPEKIPHGQQHFKIVSFAGSMRERGATEEEIYAALVVFNRDRCEKPGTDEQMRKYARSMMRYTPQQAREETRKFEARQREKAGPKLTLPPTIQANVLMAKKIPPPRWAVPELIPAGVTVLAGKPKQGKSFLALQTAIAVAAGGRAFGKIQVQQGVALYLALEDTEFRLQSRLAMLLDGAEPPSALTLCTEWPALNQHGQATLDLWFQDHADTRLVIVDTLAKMRGPRSAAGNVYDEDYAAMGAFKKVADTHNCSVVIIHHVRKADAEDPFDGISGSYGIGGSVDNQIVLRRRHKQIEASLFVRGRDVQEDEKALLWENHTAWTFLGNAEEFNRTREQREVLEAFRAAGHPIDAREASDLMGVALNVGRTRLCRAHQRGLIARVGSGLYWIAEGAPEPGGESPEDPFEGHDI